VKFFRFLPSTMTFLLVKVPSWVNFSLIFILSLSLLSSVFIEAISIEDSNGGSLYTEGVRLFKQQQYDEAKSFFWKSVLMYQDARDKSFYTTNIAMNNLLVSYSEQGNLASGYAFVAREMHLRNDQRARNYLKMAHELERDNPDVKSLMMIMGETRQSIMGLHYKEESEKLMLDKSERMQQTNKPGSCSNTNSCRETLLGTGEAEILVESGWDIAAQAMYDKAKIKLSKTQPMVVYIPSVQPFVVADDPWWQNVDGNLSWEPETFQIFRRYITDKTTVVDFGTWIGPTLLFHAQFSKRSFGLEADPVAYATMQHNLELNQHNLGSNTWATRAVLESIAVSTPDDAGRLTMQSAEAGNSGSGVGDRIMDGAQHQWTVNGYSLPYIFTNWGIELLRDSPIFIKIDIESYECSLVPSFYDWFRDEPMLPTIFVSFHPPVEPCTKSQMEAVLEVFKLYVRATCKDDKEVLDIQLDTTFQQFEEMLINATCLTDKDNSDFVLSGRSEPGSVKSSNEYSQLADLKIIHMAQV